MPCVQVEVRHGKNGGGARRAYKVKGLTTKAADEAEFDNDQEGGRMTVAAYFQQAYGIGCACSPSLWRSANDCAAAF